MENKNTIIAIMLMLLVWVGFSYFFPPAPPHEKPAVEGNGALEPPEVSSAGEDLVAQSPPEFDPGLFENAQARTLTVDTDLYTLKLSTQGAGIASLVLKNFNVTPDEDSPPIELVDDEGVLATLTSLGSEGFSVDGSTIYSVSAEGEVRLEPGEKREITFSTRLDNGVVLQKIYTFYGDQYPFDLSHHLSNTGNTPVSGSLHLALVQPWDESLAGSQFEFVGAMTLVGTDLQKVEPEDLDEGPVIIGTSPVWTGFSDKYFLRAVVPLENSAKSARILFENAMVQNVIESPYMTLVPGQSVDLEYMGYYGPKDIDILASAGHQLSEAIDFGFFSFLARPLLHVLKFFYGFIGNFGVAIILLTVIIKLIFWPLTHKSYSSMKDMQKLQEPMKKLREKYKNDKERLNRELMELYKKHRVNPLGGCLPMVVQIPVFFALYRVLLDSIELRHAPFALWITDLSAKDPYYITPIIMGATMFIQQKMTPSQMDPTQAKLFLMMPVIFTFMFLNFPSGLVIYWLVNNLLTIGQQYLINRKPR